VQVRFVRGEVGDAIVVERRRIIGRSAFGCMGSGCSCIF
jgi:hypothetical protein